MAAATSLSFFHATLYSTSYCHQQQHLFTPSEVVTLGFHKLPIVEAKSHTRREDRTACHIRIRKKVEGTPDRPRLCVFHSNKHLYVQVIDDTRMHILASASTMQKPISEEIDYPSGPTIEVAQKVGEMIARSCLEKGISKVAFDRGGYPYHGRVKALAEAARENGLEFYSDYNKLLFCKICAMCLFSKRDNSLLSNAFAVSLWSIINMKSIKRVESSSSSLFRS